ncbi:MAG TPA: response regulator [Solirubrobacteraceae bacterium]|nr:response regulator [Solirubrobacteraceae bacterium]
MTRTLDLLLIEDSEADAELVLHELRRSGFATSPLRVDNEAALRDALTTRDWQLVLCDHGLPGFNSREALRIVQERAPDVPFVILSGTIGEEATVEALKSGVRDVVVKGNLARIGPVVDRVLTEAENLRQREQLEHERVVLQGDLVRLNEELRASELKYRLMFESNPQPLLVYDRDTYEIVAVNDALVAAYGYSRDELHSMAVLQLVPAEEAERLHALLSTNPSGVTLDQTQGGTSGAWHHQYKDGTVIEVEATSANLQVDGRDCRIVLYHNVTDRNRAAAALAAAHDAAVEASNLKSAFLANMSHEIRTPMNGVVGMNELLLGTPLDEEQRVYAEQIGRSSEQMLAMINDVLDISKLETGQLTLEIAPFALQDAIVDSCAAAEVDADLKGLRFDVDVDPDLPQLTRGDANRIRQVLQALLSNAVKFTASGAITVEARALPSRGSAEARLRIDIADTGIGIEASDLQRMFEPFTQADASMTRRYGGAGLGLALAQELVEMMNGRIGAESELGRGSKFWFELELAVASEDEARAPNESPASLAQQLWERPPVVLIAEDSRINQIVAARALERCGCRAHVVRDGREAIEALSREHFDAVLMDCQMPNMNGYDATAELRRREAAGERTPVIAMTAHAQAGEREHCLDAGMDDCITKPMRHADLAMVLARWIPTGSTSDRAVAPDAGAPR